MDTINFYIEQTDMLQSGIQWSEIIASASSEKEALAIARAHFDETPLEKVIFRVYKNGLSDLVCVLAKGDISELKF